MNERELASKVKQELNYSAGQLEDRVLVRLKRARECAIERVALQGVAQPAFAFAGDHGLSAGFFGGFVGRKWLPVATLLLVLAGGMVLQKQYLAQTDEDVDAALLASDLPLNAFIDQNFHLWLDQSQQR